MDWKKVHIFCCSICGCKAMQSKSIKELDLADLAEFHTKDNQSFLVPDDRLRFIDSVAEWQQVFTRFKHGQQWLYLHKAGVIPKEKGMVVQICEECEVALQSKQIPRYCAASGLDLGQIQAVLPPLSVAERKLIALNVPYIHVLKLNFGQPAMKGHLIAFPHDGRHAVAPLLLPRLNIDDLLLVALVGDHPKVHEQMKGKFSEILSVRIKNVYTWLRFLVACNPWYRDVTLRSEQDEEVIQLEGYEGRLLQNAVQDLGEEEELEAVATNNVAQQQGDERDSLHSILIQEQLSTDTDLMLMGVANTFGLSEKVLRARQSSKPVNEFCENDRFWLGSFPDLFPFGCGIPSKGRMPDELGRHLLLQASMRFAKTDEFVFAAFDQMQRHSLLQSTSFRVRKEHPTTTKVMELVNSEDFLNDLESAIAEPHTPKAQKLCSQLSSSIQLVGAKVPWSGFQRKKLLSTMKGYMVAFGMPSFFVTWAPCDIDSPLILRLAGVDAEAIPLTPLSERMKILCSDSVSAARVFSYMTTAILEHLGMFNNTLLCSKLLLQCACNLHIVVGKVWLLSGKKGFLVNAELTPM
ncbi:MAG: DUF6570 domain-containing protein [Pseudomonadota bacterium]